MQEPIPLLTRVVPISDYPDLTIGQTVTIGGRLWRRIGERRPDSLHFRLREVGEPMPNPETTYTPTTADKLRDLRDVCYNKIALRWSDGKKSNFQTEALLGDTSNLAQFEAWRQLHLPIYAKKKAAILAGEGVDIRSEWPAIDAPLTPIVALQPELSLEPEVPVELLAEAYPDEDSNALKARILAEFASLRNALVGHIPMTQDQLARLVALEHPKFQTWLQG